MTQDLISQLKALEADGKGMPPVHLWKPERVYDIDIRIDREGRWFHEGSEIKRKPLVKLFASVLLHEEGQYYLVTPVEKARIQVEDVPFLIVEFQQSKSGFVFRTNLDELIELSEKHPIELRKTELGELPYIKVRADLWARFNRNVYYQIVELAEEKDTKICISSQGSDFVVGRL